MKNLIIVILLAISSVSYAQKKEEGCLKANVFFLLDWSGSFDGVKMQSVGPMVKFMNAFSLDDRRVKISIMLFGNEPLIWCPLTSDEETLRLKMSQLKELKDMGGTFLYRAFEPLSEMILEDKKKREESVINLIILVSDGGFSWPINTFGETDVFRSNHTESPLFISTVFIDVSDSDENNMIRIADPGFHFRDNEFDSLVEKIKELNLCL